MFDDVFFISLIALMCGVIQVSCLPLRKLLFCSEACKHLIFWPIISCLFELSCRYVCSCILKTHLCTWILYICYLTHMCFLDGTILPCSLLSYTSCLFPNMTPQLLLIQTWMWWRHSPSYILSGSWVMERDVRQASQMSEGENLRPHLKAEMWHSSDGWLSLSKPGSTDMTILLS